MDNKNEEIEIDLKELFFVLRGKIVIIILTMLVFGVGGGLASHYLVTPMYSSTSGVYVLPIFRLVTQLQMITYR